MNVLSFFSAAIQLKPFLASLLPSPPLLSPYSSPSPADPLVPPFRKEPQDEQLSGGSNDLIETFPNLSICLKAFKSTRTPGAGPGASSLLSLSLWPGYRRWARASEHNADSEMVKLLRSSSAGSGPCGSGSDHSMPPRRPGGCLSTPGEPGPGRAAASDPIIDVGSSLTEPRCGDRH
eukprot:762902-Hanusia_phi.AAC.2